jgi:NADH-quinone oxidoreductase subunit J
VQLVAFYILSTIVVLSALFVVAAKNPVHSVLWLICAFFTSAGLLVLIGAEFLAMLLVVVYVGAVAVLFLFVVMMLDINFVELKQGFTNYLVMGSIVGLILLAEIGVVVSSTNTMVAGKGFDPHPGADTNAEALARVLFTDNLLLFQMAGLVLLIAMMGAIVLTLRARPNVKRQNIAEQTGRRRKDAIEMRDIQPGQGA